MSHIIFIHFLNRIPAIAVIAPGDLPDRPALISRQAIP
jgi:hypothetical protein